jgi:hypothetical protein
MSTDNVVAGQIGVESPGRVNGRCAGTRPAGSRPADRGPPAPVRPVPTAPIADRYAPGAAAGHDDRVHADWAQRGPDLIADGEINAPMVDQALAWLAGRVPDARRVLDIGSGPGVAACSLAELLPGAEVLAVDGTRPVPPAGAWPNGSGSGTPRCRTGCASCRRRT